MFFLYFFDRFFNYGEDQKSDLFDISEARVLEKIDGSLILIWWNPYLNEWTVSTRKMAHAEGETKFGNTFVDVVRGILGSRKIEETFIKGHTYVFEMVSPETRVVKPYSKYALYALTMRNNKTGQESPSGARVAAYELGLDVPKEYSFGTIEDH